jgi:glycosyltransferase involved in cell wall biosynthesis
MKKVNPKVSVIMAAYNADKYIKEAVDSILKQTYTDFEFIIFDDQSTDNTYGILKEYRKKDKRIILKRNRKNNGSEGFMHTLNKAVELAKGEYIARMDADDISHLDRFEKQVEHLDNNPDIHLLSTAAENISENGKHLSYFKPKLNEKNFESELLKANCIYHPSIMFRKEPIFDYRLLYVEDYDLYLQMLKSGLKFGHIEDVLLKYRVLNKSLSHKNTLRTLMHTYNAQQIYKGELRLDRVYYYDDDMELKDVELFTLEGMYKIAVYSRNYEAEEIIWAELDKRQGVFSEIRDLRFKEEVKKWIKNFFTFPGK